MPLGKNVWSLFVTFDLLGKKLCFCRILHALLAATTTNILLVVHNEEANVARVHTPIA